jgi:hypothetical protein
MNLVPKNQFPELNLGTFWLLPNKFYCLESHTEQGGDGLTLPAQ